MAWHPTVFAVCALGGALLLAPDDDQVVRSGKLEREAQAVGRLLRCPVCQGMPIGESPADMAQAMMRRVRELLREGRSQAEILDYFVARYGEWVLLQPKKSGFSVLVWGLPVVAALASLGALWAYLRRHSAPSPGLEPRGQAPLDEHGAALAPYVDEVRRLTQATQGQDDAS